LQGEARLSVVDLADPVSTEIAHLLPRLHTRYVSTESKVGECVEDDGRRSSPVLDEEVRNTDVALGKRHAPFQGTMQNN